LDVGVENEKPAATLGSGQTSPTLELGSYICFLKEMLLALKVVPNWRPSPNLNPNRCTVEPQETLRLEAEMGHWPGRKRKVGERYPSGRLKPQTRAIAPALWGRIRDFADDPMVNSELGRLSFSGELTDTQAAAGFELGGLYRCHHNQSSQTADHEPNYQDGSSRPGVRIVRKPRNSSDAALKAEETAWRAIEYELEAASRHLRSAIIDLCVENKAINPILYAEVRRFLDRTTQALEQYWSCHGKVELTVQMPPRRPSAAESTLPKADEFSEETIFTAFEQTMSQLRPDLNPEAVAKLAAMFLASID
jgi:hypothetical protein